mmetsp:Transcript_76257/g.176976  ORF Transcript_76257/g.176976 Transcript_76257/m.176976 type:complete len:280 (-) Transcript_76257:151-990(-)
MRALEQLCIKLPQNPPQHILQLFRFPGVDLGGQQGNELRVEVLRAPVSCLCTAKTLEEGKGGRRRIYEAQRELQGQACDFRQLVEQDRALQLAALAHSTRPSRACGYGELSTAVRRVHLQPLLLRVLHQILAHAAADLCKVDLAARIPQHLVVQACPAFSRRDQLLLLDASRCSRVHHEALQGGLRSASYLLLRPLFPLEPLCNTFDTCFALQLEGLAKHLAVFDGLWLGVTLWPLGRDFSAFGPREEGLEPGKVLLAPRICDDVALLTLDRDVDNVLL